MADRKVARPCCPDLKICLGRRDKRLYAGQYSRLGGVAVPLGRAMTKYRMSVKLGEESWGHLLQE
jgi:hypothetical protein